jgi:hypothetical protein
MHMASNYYGECLRTKHGQFGKTWFAGLYSELLKKKDKKAVSLPIFWVGSCTHRVSAHAAMGEAISDTRD